MEKQCTIIDRLEEACMATGWKVSATKEDHGYLFEIQRYTNFGQDVILTFMTKHLRNTDEIGHELGELWENYDPDREAILWVDENGHGKNGAPHRLRDILTDMESVEASLKDLYYAFIGKL